MRSQFPQPTRVGLANPTLGYFETTPAQVWSDAGQPNSPQPGEQPYSFKYNLRGDWLHVAADSTFIVRADFYSDNSTDVQTVMLAPGTTVNFPFNGVRIFTTFLGNAALVPGTVYSANAKGTPPAPYPVLRVFYGVGNTPAVQSIEARGRYLIAPGSAPTYLTNASTANFRANEGTKVRCDVSIAQPTGVGENSWLRPLVLLVSNDTATPYGALAPDFATFNDAGATSIAYCFATWEFIMPRGINAFRVQVFNSPPAAPSTTAMQPAFGLSTAFMVSVG